MITRLLPQISGIKNWLIHCFPKSASHCNHLGNLCQILIPSSHCIHRNLVYMEGNLGIRFFLNSPGDSNVHRSLETTGLPFCLCLIVHMHPPYRWALNHDTWFLPFWDLLFPLEIREPMHSNISHCHSLLDRTSIELFKYSGTPALTQSKVSLNALDKEVFSGLS